LAGVWAVLGLLALYFAGLTYSNGQQTDGRLSPTHQKTCANLARVQLRRCRPMLEMLGLWEIDGEDRLIHKFLKYNPSKAEYEQFRESENTRWRRWKAGKANHTQAEEQTPLTTPLQTPVGGAVGNADPVPTRTRRTVVR